METDISKFSVLLTPENDDKSSNTMVFWDAVDIKVYHFLGKNALFK